MMPMTMPKVTSYKDNVDKQSKKESKVTNSRFDFIHHTRSFVNFLLCLHLIQALYPQFRI
ncbi:hypothetical protein Pyn_09690 [Prunus yedoensis var. nudiflora]|nr:hypothetical protein Pyn_09690 [Prunus yedoensis var. nudiflora]